MRILPEQMAQILINRLRRKSLNEVERCLRDFEKATPKTLEYWNRVKAILLAKYKEH